MVVSERIVEFVEDCDHMFVNLVSRTGEKVVGGTFLRARAHTVMELWGCH